MSKEQQKLLYEKYSRLGLSHIDAIRKVLADNRLQKLILSTNL